MNASTIDDKLGPVGELERLRKKSSELDTFLSRRDPVKRSRVLFGAGISKDGKVVYVDDRINTVIDGVDVITALAMHEEVEWGVREFCGIGKDYSKDARGHRIANRAEYDEVARLFPKLKRKDAWKKYDDFIDPQLKKIEKSPLVYTPDDLATYPYEHDKKLMQQIREAQK